MQNLTKLGSNRYTLNINNNNQNNNDIYTDTIKILPMYIASNMQNSVVIFSVHLKIRICIKKKSGLPNAYNYANYK